MNNHVTESIDIAREIMNDIVIPFSLVVANDLLATLFLLCMFTAIFIDGTIVFVSFSAFVCRFCYILRSTELWDEYSDPLRFLLFSVLICNLIYGMSYIVDWHPRTRKF